MRFIKLLLPLCLLLTLDPMDLRAQYYGERVLEKSFEQTEFFFNSTPLTPYGIGGFRSVSPTIFQDPLSRLAVNPAFFSIDTLKDHYAYLDFRSVSEIRSMSNTYYYPMASYRMAVDIAILPYPRYYYDTRKELQPVFSGAYLTRPLSSLLPRLYTGVTYQALFQDDKYYPIPQDIYRSVMGYDFSGARASAEDLPTVDRYKGTDDIHHLAHMVSFFTAYELAENVKFGAKLGRTSFNREGSFGSQNLWDGYYNPNFTSNWGNAESRDQQYRDWDLSTGIQYRFGEGNEAGLVLGHLWGNAVQGVIKTDTSFYGHGTVGSGTDWSYYARSGLTDQSWDHDGGTTYGSLQLNRVISPTVTMNLSYGFHSQEVDINLSSSISDTSFNSYYYRYNDTTTYRSEGFSRLVDTRQGEGSKIANAHRFAASVNWRPDDAMSLTVGLQLELQSSETKTDEGVSSRRQSQYSYTYSQGTNTWFDRTVEEKHLLWTFTTEVTTLRIPVVIQWRATEWLDAMIGVSRSMASWNIKDVTLAVIKLRDRQSSNGSEFKEHFGERYTMPRERVSEVSTAALFGVTARPSDLFNIRLLVTPNIVDDYEGSHIQDLRWWLSFQLTP